MNASQQEFQKFLDEQRVAYRHALPEKVAQILVLWQAVASGGGAAPALAELERLVHTLAGTAGTLGFREVGEAARVLEQLLEQAGQSGSPTVSEMAQAISALQASLPADPTFS